MEGNTPEKKFSTGAISATGWRNKGVSNAGKTSEYNTISLQRRYTDKAGAWKTTTTMRVNDLPRAALVLQKAFEYLVLRDGEQSTITDSPIMEQELVM